MIFVSAQCSTLKTVYLVQLAINLISNYLMIILMQLSFGEKIVFVDSRNE